jgi:hypothetical protein
LAEGRGMRDGCPLADLVEGGVQEVHRHGSVAAVAMFCLFQRTSFELSNTRGRVFLMQRLLKATKLLKL